MADENTRPVIGPGFFIKRPEQGHRETVEEEEKMFAAIEPSKKKPLLDLVANPLMEAYLLAGMDVTGGPQIAFVRVGGGTDFPRHYHAETNAFLYIIKGTGKILLGDERYPISAGDCIQITRGVIHEVFADSAIEYLAVVFPSLEKGRFDFVFTDLKQA